MNSDNLFWAIALQRIPRIGRITARRLIDRFGTPKNIFNISEGDLEKFLNTQAWAEFRKYDPLKDSWIYEEIDRLSASKAHAITIIDENYPRNLIEIPDAPIVLYVLGRITKQDELAVGIVGTRRPSRYGVDQSRRFAQYLAKQGVTIVSGMAMGIDGNAQDSAIQAGGRSIGVLGCGVDVIYPPINRRLYNQLIENGAVVSEFPLGTPADARNFPPRNRIICGLSKAILVVEGAVKSGSLITAKDAAGQGREVFAIPGHIDRPNSYAPNTLIRDGATPALDPSDVMTALKVEPLEDDSRKAIQKLSIKLEGLSKIIFDSLDFDGVAVDTISSQTGLEINKILAILTELELLDIIKPVPGSKYARNV